MARCRAWICESIIRIELAFSEFDRRGKTVAGLQKLAERVLPSVLVRGNRGRGKPRRGLPFELAVQRVAEVYARDPNAGEDAYLEELSTMDDREFGGLLFQKLWFEEYSNITDFVTNFNELTTGTENKILCLKDLKRKVPADFRAQQKKVLNDLRVWLDDLKKTAKLQVRLSLR